MLMDQSKPKQLTLQSLAAKIHKDTLLPPYAKAEKGTRKRYEDRREIKNKCASSHRYGLMLASALYMFLAKLIGSFFCN